MSWFLLLMTAFPDIQKRAQAEIDTVVGRDRVPNFNDYEYLPFVRAVMKEILRWRPVDPLGLPHRSTEDDWYEGHYIPAGSVLIPNVWQLNRDPDVYGPEADQFIPARHLDASGKMGASPIHTKDEGHVSYGFGRRICIGRHVANNSLFINASIMLWAMNIEHAKDENGNIVQVDIENCVEDGIVV